MDWLDVGEVGFSEDVGQSVFMDLFSMFFEEDLYQRGINPLTKEFSTLVRDGVNKEQEINNLLKVM